MADDNAGTIDNAIIADAGAAAPPPAAESRSLVSSAAADTLAAGPSPDGDGAAETRGGGKRPADAGAAAGAGWPQDWRERLAGADEKALKQLKRIVSPEALLKKLQHQETLIRSRAGPPEEESGDALAAWRRAHDVPAAPSGYLDNLTLSAGKVLGDADRPVAESFAAEMHAIGAPQEMVERGIDWYLAYREKLANDDSDADIIFREESQARLRQSFGAGWNRAVASIGALLAETPEVRDMLLGGRAGDGRLLGDHPLIVRWLAELARRVHPSATVVLSGGSAARGMEARIAEIEALQRRDRSAYFRDEALQAELRELYAKRERSGRR
jgi:hypothetical protein